MTCSFGTVSTLACLLIASIVATYRTEVRLVAPGQIANSLHQLQT